MFFTDSLLVNPIHLVSAEKPNRSVLPMIVFDNTLGAHVDRITYCISIPCWTFWKDREIQIKFPRVIGNWKNIGSCFTVSMNETEAPLWMQHSLYSLFRNSFSTYHHLTIMKHANLPDGHRVADEIDSIAILVQDKVFHPLTKPVAE